MENKETAAVADHAEASPHFDEKASDSVDADDNATYGFVANTSTLPPGYYYSPYFLGTMTATGVGLAVAVGGFGLAAPNLALIDSEIGPSANIYWVSLIYTLMMAIGLLLVGRLSDLFGRRVSLPLLSPVSCFIMPRLSDFRLSDSSTSSLAQPLCLFSAASSAPSPRMSAC